jgi:hypothetical protein
MTHESPVGEKPTSCWILGNAMVTIVESRPIMSWQVTTIARATRGCAAV